MIIPDLNAITLYDLSGYLYGASNALCKDDPDLALKWLRHASYLSWELNTKSSYDRAATLIQALRSIALNHPKQTLYST
jgi:hypothetical protein